MINNQLLFVIPALPDFVPYVYNYLKIADECGRKYDVVCWNRKDDKDVVLPSNYMVYNHFTRDDFSSFKKLSEIYGFYRFVKKSIRGRQYDVVFTFTIADSIFFGPWLSKCYKGRFVFDIRDYSPLIDNCFFSQIIKRMFRTSAMNVISSDGFRKWLPKGFNYIVCHNTDIDKVKQSVGEYENRKNYDKLHLLTIGNLRNADANRKVIDAFANHEDVVLSFAGGGVAEQLRQHCEENGIKNVAFTGRYQKENEDDIVRQCDMMNIMLPHDPVADHLMSNRFYLSARLRKPMMVNEGCFQAEQIKKYGIGMVVREGDNLYSSLFSYWRGLDWVEYNKNCVRFLQDVCGDLDIFKQKTEQVIENRKDVLGGKGGGELADCHYDRSCS